MAVLGIVLAIVVAYLAVMGAVVLVYSWSWLRARRADSSPRHRLGRSDPAGTATPGGGGVR